LRADRLVPVALAKRRGRPFSPLKTHLVRSIAAHPSSDVTRESSPDGSEARVKPSVNRDNEEGFGGVPDPPVRPNTAAAVRVPVRRR
jgi:hypothetical protein